jgi:DNA-binding transcriptional regulator YiaG
MLNPKSTNTSVLIRHLRRQLNLSQEQFAARLGVSFKTVNRWENGHTTPSPMALKLIAALVEELNQSNIALANQSLHGEELEQ